MVGSTRWLLVLIVASVLTSCHGRRRRPDGGRHITQGGHSTGIEIGLTEKADFFARVTHFLGKSSHHVELLYPYGVSILVADATRDVVLTQGRIVLRLLMNSMKFLEHLVKKHLKLIRTWRFIQMKIIQFVNSIGRKLISVETRDKMTHDALNSMAQRARTAIFFGLQVPVGIIKKLQGRLCIRFPEIPQIQKLSFEGGQICPFNNIELNHISVSKTVDGEWEVLLPFEFNDANVVFSKVTMGTLTVEGFNLTVGKFQANFSLDFSNDVIPNVDAYQFVKPSILAAGCSGHVLQAGPDVKGVIDAVTGSCNRIVNEISIVIPTLVGTSVVLNLSGDDFKH